MYSFLMQRRNIHRGGRFVRRLDHDPARLRRRRYAAGLDQYELATLAEISPGHMSEIETGRRNPSPKALARIAAALKCTPEDLMPQAA